MRGSFEEEMVNPTCFTAWVQLDKEQAPIPFDTLQDALNYIDLEASWQRQE